MDQTEVQMLQGRIADAAEHLKYSELMLEGIKQKLKVLQEATSDESLKAFSHPPGSAAHVVVVDPAVAEEPLSAEDKQAREKAMRAFNLNPLRGIELLKEYLGGSSQLASFFAGTPGLNKHRLGEWLGEASEESVQTLALFAFAFATAFTDQPFEHALRSYCAKFEMPSASKKIDRITEAFANAYHSANPSAFGSVDAVHILAFSCVMLSADVHKSTSLDSAGSPKSLEAFVNNLRGVDGGGDFPRPLLESLHRSLGAHELAAPVERLPGAVEPLFTSCSKAGYLRKQGGIHTSWSNRFFVMCDRVLAYFEKEGELDMRGLIVIGSLRAQVVKRTVTLVPTQGSEKVTSLKFDKKTGEISPGNHKTVVLAATTEADAHAWADLINELCS